MAYIDVKITDLTQVSSIKNDDLFLVSHPLIDSDGALQDTPYTSNSISGGALSSTLRELFENHTLCVDNGDWHFHTTIENIPTQDFKLQIDQFIDALELSTKLTSIIQDDDPSGWYHGLSSSFLQNPANRSGTAQSLSVLNNSIPNVDFVERAIAGAYRSLLNQLTTIISPDGNSHFIPSHIGEIIHSTRLSSETLVRNVYGHGQVINGIQYPDTHWKKHSGYFLRGANSSQPDNNNKNDANFNGGGQDSFRIGTGNLPNHTHSATFTGSSSSFSGSFTSSGSFLYTLGSTTASGKNNQAATPTKFTSKVSGSIKGSVTPKGSVSVTGGGKGTPDTIDNRPVYKNVFIWERVS